MAYANDEIRQNVEVIALGCENPNLNLRIEFGIPIVSKHRRENRNIVVQLYSSNMRGTHIFLLDGKSLPVKDMPDECEAVQMPEWAFILRRQIFLFWAVEDSIKSMTEQIKHHVIMAHFALPSQWRPGTIFQAKVVRRIDVTSDYAHIDRVHVVPLEGSKHQIVVDVHGPELFIDRELPPSTNILSEVFDDIYATDGAISNDANALAQA